MVTEMSQTLDRGLLVLQSLCDSPEGLTVTELSERLGVSRTIVYRLVATLEGRRFVRRSSDRRCRLGVGALALGRGAHPAMRMVAVPFLRRLADQVRATAHLTLVQDGEPLAVAVVEAGGPVRAPTRTRAGTRTHGPDRGLSGRAAVATVAEAQRLEPGWVVSGGGAGTFAVAAPVLGVPGLEASVGVLSPVELDPPTVGPNVVAAAAGISDALR